MVTRSGARWDGPGHGAAMAGGTELSAPVVFMDRAGKSARGERGIEEKLTGI